MGWWFGLVLLDVFVAALLLTGAFTLLSLSALQNTPGLVRGAFLGLFGPLALRSPVRRASIGGRPEQVGITYVYDRVRIWLDRGLDERITRLRRADRNRLREEVQQHGWDAATLRARLDEHPDELKSAAPGDPERIRKAIRAAMTLPAKDQMSALLKIALDERFTGVIDDLKTSQPTADDRRRGRRLARRPQ